MFCWNDPLLSSRKKCNFLSYGRNYYSIILKDEARYKLINQKETTIWRPLCVFMGIELKSQQGHLRNRALFHAFVELMMEEIRSKKLREF